MSEAGRSVRTAYLAIGLCATVLFALNLGTGVNAAAFAVLGGSTVLALLLGPLVNNVPRTPWYLVAAASVLFAVGVAVRPQALMSPSWPDMLSDLFVLPGYLLALLALGLLLRRRDGVRDVHATTDMLIVLTGAASLAISLLGAPAAQLDGRPPLLSVVSAIYPVLDVLLLCILVQIGFTSRSFSWSLISMSAAIMVLLVADYIYAWRGTRGVLSAPHWVDVLFAITFLLVGLTALHPSARELSIGQRRPVQSWSLVRVLLVVPSLGAPVVLLATLRNDAPEALRWLLVGLSLLGVVLLVVRAMTAVHALGRVQRDTLHEATHDPLTGLPNRVLLDRWLVGQLARRRSLTLLYLDLDGFKLVNDSFGHASGDELLGALAQRLRRLTPPGALLSRLGGDEFVITYAEPGPSAHALAAEVLAAIREPFSLDVAQVVVTGSIGIAVSGAATSAQDLLREADTAMYRAKAAGRGAVATYDDSMRGSVRERLELEQALRQAMALGQLTVEFQPVVDLMSGRVESHEALLRWLHPIRGEVPTETFITLAEEAGLLTEIGDWVLDEALRALARRRADGCGPLTVAVNVAGRQLADPMLTERVTAALRRHGLPSAALKLEITESAMMQDDCFVAETVTSLFDAGVTLSMDDFGTGFSSLSYLRRLPVSEVKIDRSFVAGIVTSVADEEIVRAATAMAHALRLRVVAEGVETPEQRDMLLRLGVDCGQGWLFGRPQPFSAPLSLRGRAPLRPTAARHSATG